MDDKESSVCALFLDDDNNNKKTILFLSDRKNCVHAQRDLIEKRSHRLDTHASTHTEHTIIYIHLFGLFILFLYCFSPGCLFIYFSVNISHWCGVRRIPFMFEARFKTIERIRLPVNNVENCLNKCLNFFSDFLCILHVVLRFVAMVYRQQGVTPLFENFVIFHWTEIVFVLDDDLWNNREPYKILSRFSLRFLSV